MKKATMVIIIVAIVVVVGTAATAMMLTMNTNKVEDKKPVFVVTSLSLDKHNVVVNALSRATIGVTNTGTLGGDYNVTILVDNITAGT